MAIHTLVTGAICRTDPECSKRPACCISEGVPPFEGRELDRLAPVLQAEMRAAVKPTDQATAPPCSKLTGDGTCGIYAVRPDGCRNFPRGSAMCHWYRMLAGYRVLR